MKQYIAYLRVSTKGQARSGLGLEAQRAIIEHYARLDGAELVQEVIEAESGKGMDNRPKLQQVIRDCNQYGYTLIVAKLDRLSRDIVDTFNILKQLNQKLISCDIPTQNGTLDSLTLAVFAGLAQRERELISIRTKQALQAKKARGTTLGSPHNLTQEAKNKAIKSIKQKAMANPNNSKARAMIAKCQKEGLTLQQTANELNQSNFKTSTGKDFHRMSVSRLLK